jgi:phosphoribosyl-AMP cyclohydrolase
LLNNEILRKDDENRQENFFSQSEVADMQPYGNSAAVDAFSTTCGSIFRWSKYLWTSNRQPGAIRNIAHFAADCDATENIIALSASVRE